MVNKQMVLILTRERRMSETLLWNWG